MQQNSNSKPPQTSLLLRLLGGGYLVYLAWDIFGSGTATPIQMTAAAVFAVVGGALAGTSLYSLVTSSYFYDAPQKKEETDGEEGTE